MAPSRIDDNEELVDSSSNQVDSSKPTVYLLDAFHPQAIQYCRKRFNAILPGDAGHEEWRQKAEYLLIRSSRLTAEDVAACPRLKAIGKQGVGIDKIDEAACRSRGIPIFNTPGVNAQAVAEAVVALTMGVAREVPRIVREQSRGVRVPKETCSGLIIHRKTIGIVGMGHIGKAVARIFRGGFDADIIAYDPFAPADAWTEADGGVPHRRAETVEEVLRACDVLSLHVPLTAETRGLVSYDQMKQMKSTAIIINAARGGIVNETDLERALREGLIWGAGLDCHEEEPPTREKYGELWEQRVLSTPHVGAATSQTQAETATAAVQRLYEFCCANEKASS